MYVYGSLAVFKVVSFCHQLSHLSTHLEPVERLLEAKRMRNVALLN